MKQLFIESAGLLSSHSQLAKAFYTLNTFYSIDLVDTRNTLNIYFTSGVRDIRIYSWQRQSTL